MGTDKKNKPGTKSKSSGLPGRRKSDSSATHRSIRSSHDAQKSRSSHSSRSSHNITQSRSSHNASQSRNGDAQPSRTSRNSRNTDAPQFRSSRNSRGNNESSNAPLFSQIKDAITLKGTSYARAESGAGMGNFSEKTHKIAIGLLIILALVVGRLFWLQIIDGSVLAQEARDNRTNTFVIHAKRGTIYDRNGNVLAASVECKTLYANPHEIKDGQKAAEILAANLGGTADDYLPLVTKDTTFVYLKKKVESDVAKKTLSDLDEADIQGIYTLSDMKRIYPYGATAGQVLGVVGTDGEGLTGLELEYNDILSGKNGEKVMETGLYGTPIAGGAYEEIPAKNGTDIMISLDINIQQAAEQAIADGMKTNKAARAQAIVTQPKTGDILAMCSTPFLDLTNQENLDPDSLNLAGVSDAYEPGSVMKVLLAGLGIESKAFTPASVFSVPTSIKVGDDTVKDATQRSATESMSVTNILERSSNVGAVLLSRELGTTALETGYANFGIGKLTGIDYPGEAEGIVTDPEEATSTIAGANAFGQALSIPSIQTVRAVGAIANGGVLETPHFLLYKGNDKVDWPSGPQVISAESASQVAAMMNSVVMNGTAKKAQIEGYQISGKTGTGEQASSTGSYKKGSYYSSFIGFAPTNDPQVLVFVGYNDVATVAETASVPTFTQIMKEALLDMGIGTTL